MDWHQEYMALSERDREEFSRVISVLFDQTFLVRDTWDGRERRPVTNRDYRFAERLLPILCEYLSVSGFQLQVDGRRGVIALYSRFDRNRMRMDKFTTYVLYILRLIYDEQMEQASMRREVVVPLREVHVKLHTIGLTDRRVSAVNLQETLNKLRRRTILERIEGDAQDIESRWIIYPSITILVSDERINEIYDRFASGELGDSSPRVQGLEVAEDEGDLDNDLDENWVSSSEGVE